LAFSTNVNTVISNSFWNSEITAATEPVFGGGGELENVMGLSTAEMQDQMTYINAGWDFDTVWMYAPELNDGYPSLRETVDINFTSNVTIGIDPLTVQFYNLSRGTIDSYEWFFGDMEMEGIVEENPVWVFTSPGHHSVKLVVNGTNELIKQNYISVVATPRTIDFTSDVTTGVAPLTVEFFNLCKGGEIISCFWYFQNSEIVNSIEMEPIWVFNDPGFYTIKLVVNGYYEEIKEDYIVVFPPNNDDDITNKAVYSSVYPNPVVNNEVTIKTNIADNYLVLKIYNIKGQLVKQSNNYVKKDNEKHFEWNYKNNSDLEVSSGMYFYQIISKNEIQKGKFLILKN
jgi:PKD repeat protein